MRLLIGLIFLIIICSCSKTDNDLEIESFKSKGLDGKPEYIYFKNDNEGYAFVNSEVWSSMSKDQLKDPNFTPQPQNIAFILETKDGGKNWIKLKTLENKHFVGNVVLYADSFFGGLNDFYNDKYFLFAKDSSENYSEFLVNSFYRFYVYQDLLYFSNINGIYKINFTNQLLYSIDKISDFKIGIYSVFFEDFFLTINRNNTGINGLYKVEDNEKSNIKLPFTPECLIKKDENEVLIIGKNPKVENLITIFKYRLTDKSTSDIILEIPNYSIIKNLQSNGNTIVGFIGNISGMFTTYDLLYSVDGGSTWKIKKLNADRIGVSYLLQNVMYTYTGGGTFQKIYFQ